MSQTDYWELQIKINPDLEDIVAEFCFENLPCEGVVLAEEAYKDLEMISTTEGTLKVFLTEEPQNLEQLLKSERELLKSRGLSAEELGSWEYVISNKPNEDWSKKWKEKWDITRVTDKIVIVPDWLSYEDKEGEVVIRLEPGCAFGTGTHQTTQLCMKALEKYMKKGDKVADIGMGSGILSICAKKLGASYVHGCDIDEDVIDVAKENAVKNGVTLLSRPNEERKELLSEVSELSNSGEGCYFELNTADKIQEKFDFVCANILHNVLAEIMGDLKNIMKSGAIMSLSGILDEKKPVVLEAIKRENLEIIEEIHQDQWTSFVVRKGV